MRLWVFDRSGLYSSEKFDIYKELERFIQVIAGYALMMDAELGLNTYIGRDGDKSTKELLEALRDAIRGYKSLLKDGKILHRDISENNIIITEAASKGEPTGRLIDLDLAKELDSVPSGASHRTGTMQFMAIEVLQGKGYTYRHDLESQARKKLRPLTTSALRDWYTRNYRQIASTKLGHMDKNGFEDIITEFALRFENLKALARELRNVLFPIRDGAIFTGTFCDNDIMYNRMIEAFNKAIASLGKED
ncbi:hypothetical protein V498_01166 [Pseudogymnoascus sp. VKM F-4517 (FW-2822)]|nr:hypothetical protein V498_01166 [Pseudogymnoascus sp. VKM F-4517 (FW-2822)]